MRRVCCIFLACGILAWLWVTLKQSEKRGIEKLAEALLDSLRGRMRRGMIFSRLLPSFFLRKLLRRFS